MSGSEPLLEKQMMTLIRRWFFKKIGKTPADMPVVRYWKTQAAVQAKVTTNEDGALVMHMEGEDYPFPGFPRGYLLFGPLSKLKHEIKNQIFNACWALIGKDEGIMGQVYAALGNIYQLAEKTKYDMVPPEKMVKAVREIHRAWTKVAPQHTKLRDILCFILQEDDSYRFRVQWVAQYMKKKPTGRTDYWLPLYKGLENLQHAEVIADMKERQLLLRTVLLSILTDKRWAEAFNKLCHEIDWNKVVLSEGDKYHFRGKYFKVDFDLFDY